MEKPPKSRRRRSIRNLRASTSFSSAPEAECYGSAWIEQGQDTNMDNLVMSLSHLTFDDKQADGAFTANGESIGSSSLSQYPVIHTTMPHSSDILHGSHFDERTADDEDVYQEISSTVPFCDSFSFREDMPLSVNPLETDLERPYPPTGFLYKTLSKKYGDDCEEHQQDAQEFHRDKHFMSNSMIQITENEYGSDHYGDYLEHGNSNLSLNFSPLPEEDQSINCLVKSLNCGFNLSFSPQGDRPDTPRFSQQQNDDQETYLFSTLHTSDLFASPNVDLTSKNNSLGLDQTFVLSKRTQEADPGEGISPFTQNSVSPSDIHNTSQHISIRQLDLEDGFSSDYTGNADFNHECSGNSGFIMSESSVFSDNKCLDSSNVTELTNTATIINSLQENRFCELIEETHASIAMESSEDHSSELVSNNVFETTMEKQKKRKKRRSSRQFQLQEFYVAFRNSDDSSPKSVISDAICDSHNLHSINVMESEKENFCDFNSDFSFRDNHDKSGLSDCSNDINIGKKKKNGRKSSGRNYSKKKCLSVGKDNFNFSSEKCDATQSYDNICHSEPEDHQQSHCLKDSDHLEYDRISDLHPLIPEQEPSSTANSEDNESAHSGRRLRTKRKSWGIAMPRSVRKQSDENQSHSQVQLSCSDNVDLDQVYLQKYSPITPQLLETIKEVPSKGLVIGKQKLKRFIKFPEDYRPTVWKEKSRTKKVMKHFKKCVPRNRIGDEEFHSKLQDIMINLAEFED